MDHTATAPALSLSQDQPELLSEVGTTFGILVTNYKPNTPGSSTDLKTIAAAINELGKDRTRGLKHIPHIKLAVEVILGHPNLPLAARAHFLDVKGSVHAEAKEWNVVKQAAEEAQWLYAKNLDEVEGGQNLTGLFEHLSTDENVKRIKQRVGMMKFLFEMAEENLGGKEDGEGGVEAA